MEWAVLIRAYASRAGGEWRRTKACGREPVTPVYYIGAYMLHIGNLVLCEGVCSCFMEGKRASEEEHTW